MKTAFVLVALSAFQAVSLTSAFTTTATTTTTTAVRPAFFTKSTTTTSPSPSSIRGVDTRSFRTQHHHYNNAFTRLYMGWGPDPVWSAASVTSFADACPSKKSVLVTVAVSPETAASYAVPGQYIQARLSGSDDENNKPLFLAICSAPNPENASFEFLIKKTDSNGWFITACSKVGAALEISQVLGTGYNIQENLEGFKYDFPTQNVLLFAAGSGIAPLVAAIECGQLETKTRTCRLYYGERTADDLCFVDRFAKWEEMGVQVVPVLSQPDDSNWKGRSGYVQTALAEDGIAIPRNTGALLCGMKGMNEAVKELLLASGVFEGRVLFNF